MISDDITNLCDDFVVLSSSIDLGKTSNNGGCENEIGNGGRDGRLGGGGF